MGSPVHREMGGLGKSLAAFIAGVRFETQVDIHVMLQLNPGPKLLVTPGDKPHSQYSAYAANEQIVPTFGIGTSARQGQAWREEVDVVIGWPPQPAEGNQSEHLPVDNTSWEANPFYQHMPDLILIIVPKIFHLSVLFSAVKAQLNKAAETLATVITPKVSLSNTTIKI